MRIRKFCLLMVPASVGARANIVTFTSIITLPVVEEAGAVLERGGVQNG